MLHETPWSSSSPPTESCQDTALSTTLTSWTPLLTLFLVDLGSISIVFPFQQQRWRFRARKRPGSRNPVGKGGPMCKTGEARDLLWTIDSEARRNERGCAEGNSNKHFWRIKIPFLWVDFEPWIRNLREEKRLLDPPTRTGKKMGWKFLCKKHLHQSFIQARYSEVKPIS